VLQVQLQCQLHR